MMTDHTRSPPASSTLRQTSSSSSKKTPNGKKSSSKSKRSGNEEEEEKKESKEKSSSSGGSKKDKKSSKKEKKEDDKVSKKSSHASGSKSKKNGSDGSKERDKVVNSSSKHKSTSKTIRRTNSTASAGSGSATKEDKEKKKISSSSKDKNKSKEKQKSVKREKNGRRGSLSNKDKKLASKKISSKSSRTKPSDDPSKKTKSRPVDEPPSKRLNKQLAEEAEQIQRRSPRRVSFDLEPQLNNSHQNDSDTDNQSAVSESSSEEENMDLSRQDAESVDSSVSGAISSSEDSFAMDDDGSDGGDLDDNDTTTEEAKNRALPTVALKAMRAMKNLKHVEPASYQNDPVDQSSSSSIGSGNAPRRASIANDMALSPMIRHNLTSSPSTPTSAGIDWGKLNRKLTYKHVRRPDRLSTDKRAASEQTGKFFQLIQQQQQGTDGSDPMHQRLTSAVEHRAKNSGFPPPAAKSPQRIPRTRRVKNEEDLEAAKAKRSPKRVLSMDSKLNRSLSSLANSRIRRNKSHESASAGSQESQGSGSKGSGSKGGSVGSGGRGARGVDFKNNQEVDMSSSSARRRLGDASQKSASSHESTLRKKDMHKSFSNHDRPSAGRRRRDMTNGKLNKSMSIDSGAAARRLRRHKSDDDHNNKSPGGGSGIRRHRSMDDESNNANNNNNTTGFGRVTDHRKARTKVSNGGGRGKARRRRNSNAKDETSDVEFSDLELKQDGSNLDEFGFLAPQHDEFMSMFDIVKKPEGKRDSIWDI